MSVILYGQRNDLSIAQAPHRVMAQEIICIFDARFTHTADFLRGHSPDPSGRASGPRVVAAVANGGASAVIPRRASVAVACKGLAWLSPAKG